MNMETVGMLLLLLNMRMFLFLLSIHGRESYFKRDLSSIVPIAMPIKILIPNLDYKIANIISPKDNKVKEKVILDELRKEDPNVLHMSLSTLSHPFINTLSSIYSWRDHR